MYVHRSISLISTVFLAVACLPLRVTAGEGAAAYYEAAVAHLNDGDRLSALIELRNAVQADRTYTPAWITLARTRLEEGDPAAAKRAAEQAIALGADVELTIPLLARSMLMLGDLDGLLGLPLPRNLSPEKTVVFLNIQGDALLDANVPGDARKKFEAALAIEPGSAAAHRGLALAQSRRGLMQGAERAARQAVELAPEDAESWYVRGEVRRGQRKFQAALEDFDHALSLNPAHTPSMLGRAAILIDAGRVEQAHALLLDYNARAPDELQGLYLLSQVELSLGNDFAAEQALNHAQDVMAQMPAEALAENLPAMMVGALLALRSDAPERARELLQSYLQRVPGHIGATKLLSVSLLRLGHGTEARRHLRALTTYYPSDPHLKLLLGAAYALEGDIDAAKAAEVEARGSGSARVWLTKMLGLAMARSGDTDGAIAAFEEALRFEEGASDTLLMAVLSHIQGGRVERARGLVEALIEREPAVAAFANLAGALELMSGHPDRAARHFERATLLAPEMEAPQLNLAELARQAGRFEEARTRYQALLGAERTNIGALRGLAEVAASEGAGDVAIGWLERIRKIAPEKIDDRVVLLKAYLGAGRVDDALAESRELLGVARDRVPVVVAGALAEHAAGRPVTAKTLLREASSSVSLTSPDADLIATAQSRLNFSSDAQATRRAAIERWPARIEHRYALALELITAGALDEAREQIDLLHAQASGTVHVHLASAELAMARGAPADAATHYRRALELEPRAAVAARLAGALLQAGEPDAAVELLRVHVEREGNRPGAASAALAGVYVASGRYAEAAEVFESILRVDPTNWRVRNNLAWTYEQLGDPRALEEARHVLAQKPGHPATLDTAGWILGRRGELDEAIRLLREAAARDSTEPRIRVHLAQVLIERGLEGEAREHLRFVLEKGSGAGLEEAQRMLTKLGECPTPPCKTY